MLLRNRKTIDIDDQLEILRELSVPLMSALDQAIQRALQDVVEIQMRDAASLPTEELDHVTRASIHRGVVDSLGSVALLGPGALELLDEYIDHVIGLRAGDF